MTRGDPLGDEQLEALQRSPLIAALGKERIASLVGSCDLVQAHPGQELFGRGTPAAHVHIVVKGWVSLYRDQIDGARSVIHLFGPGDSFGEALLAPSSVNPVTAGAVTVAEVVRVELAAIRKLLASSPEAALAVLASCFRHFRHLVDHIEHVTAWSARRRVAHFVLELCQPGLDACRIVIPVEQHLIAAHLNMTPSTFSRSLRSLASVGVDAARGEIHVASVRALSKVVEAE